MSLIGQGWFKVVFDISFDKFPQSDGWDTHETLIDDN